MSRINEERYWKEKKGKLLHLRVIEVFPLDSGSIEVFCDLLEDDERFRFEILTGEEKE